MKNVLLLLVLISFACNVQAQSKTIKGKVLNHLKTKKITGIKMKRRKDYRKKQGHRQNLTKVKIESISYGT